MIGRDFLTDAWACMVVGFLIMILFQLGEMTSLLKVIAAK